MPTSSGLPYDELVYHMDLCILSYALYTQTLVWPFDPYYEGMSAKGTSRRDKVVAGVRAWAAAGLAQGRTVYHGPGGAQGAAWLSNDDLDPIMFRYDRLQPWLPAFCRPESKWLLYEVPPEITTQIASVRMCKYNAANADPNIPSAGNANILGGTPQLGGAVNNPNPAGGAADIVYCFEGGTGGKPGGAAADAAHWSLMGFVLERDKGGGHYDVHITFRGSRSGSGARALVHGAFKGKGNPDWVTDMDVGTMVADTVFSVHGSVSRGFSYAVKTCLPNILACLSAVQANHAGPAVAPDNIWVTGHSLGGALATHFAAAMVVGSEYGPNGQGASMPAALLAWPWDRMKLVTVSAPMSGGKSFHRNFNSKVYCRRLILSKDPIAKDPPRVLSGRNAVKKLDLHHVGSEVYITAENTLGHVLSPLPATGDHEPKEIRKRLIRKLNQWGDLPNAAAAPYVHDPWNLYASFNAMSLHAAMTNAVINALLTGVDVEAGHYLGIVGPVMGTDAAYKTFIRVAQGLARTGAVATAVGRIGVTAGQGPMVARNSLIATVAGVRANFPDDVADYLGGILILAELGNNANLVLGTFGGDVRLMRCIS